MELNIRKLEENDYENILVNWWNDYNWTPPFKNFLPDNGTGGFIVYSKDIPICAGFIYKTNSKVAWVDWIISDKNYEDKKIKAEALKYLITTMSSICKELGYIYAYALIKHKGLTKLYEKLGYIKADQYTQELIKQL
jgi:RimJ/RimL family protein N-acetyltransferase